MLFFIFIFLFLFFFFKKKLLPPNSKERNNVRAIILVPTRELADQVHKHIKDLTIYLPDITSINISSGEQSQTK